MISIYRCILNIPIFAVSEQLTEKNDLFCASELKRNLGNNLTNNKFFHIDMGSIRNS
ncbi:hypothetical protein WA026_021759 [Henosepilachna vigintioctopunctata]|uniref:Uncharacterized protein n=1 Tax=Henosepilachna vigintioctopunctata TaxID=420089 RepID=A0AAW1TXF5_9CUCU